MPPEKGKYTGSAFKRTIINHVFTCQCSLYGNIQRYLHDVCKMYIGYDTETTKKKETPNMRPFTEQVGYIEIAVLCLVQIRIFNQETGMSLFHSLLCLRQ